MPFNKKKTKEMSLGIALWVLLGLAVFGVYAKSLQVPFLFDDLPNIRDNRHLHITDLHPETLAKAGRLGPSANRPIPKISFALNYYFHGDQVVGFHLVNMVIHLLCGLAFFFLIRLTPGMNTPGGYPRMGFWLPFFAAMVWVVHPLHTQSVTYIVQRMNSMAALFCLLSMVCYAKGRLVTRGWGKTGLYSGCVLAGLLALATKENSAALPLMIFVYEWYFFQDLNPQWLVRKKWHIIGLVLILCCVALIFLGIDPIERLAAAYTRRDFTMGQRVLTQFRVVFFYVSLWLLPHPGRLNLDHHTTVSTGLMAPPTTMLSIIGVVLLVLLIILTARRHRLLSFAILWYLMTIAIESSVIGLELIFEHRTYLPTLFLCLVVTRSILSLKHTVWLKTAGLCCLALVLSVWTYQRNLIWQDELTLWQDSATKSPQKARPHNNLGNALGRQGAHEKAVVQFRKALRLKPNYDKAHYNLANTLERLDQPKEAERHYRQALSITPNYLKAHINLGSMLRRQGKFDEAIHHFRQALASNPRYSPAHNNLGNALAQQGKLEEAVTHFKRALKLHPNYAKAHNNLANAFVRQGKINAAILHYAEALRLRPKYVKAYNNLGVALLRRGDFQAAMDQFSIALKLDPSFASARRNMEWVRRRLEGGSQGHAHEKGIKE